MFLKGNYTGNPIIKQKELHQKSKMKEAYFQHRNALLSTTIDELFTGEKAEEIKQRAMNIKLVLIYKTLNGKYLKQLKHCKKIKNLKQKIIFLGFFKKKVLKV